MEKSLIHSLILLPFCFLLLLLTLISVLAFDFVVITPVIIRRGYHAGIEPYTGTACQQAAVAVEVDEPYTWLQVAFPSGISVLFHTRIVFIVKNAVCQTSQQSAEGLEWEST